jgi:conjugative relaxase-like TrwC/TraI family protein
VKHQPLANFTVLRINVIANAAAAKSYYEPKNADYYIEGHEAQAQWYGKAADALGLSGAVSMEQFYSLCDNKHPTTGESITGTVRDDRRVGFDLTFSVPKSVSLLHSVGKDERVSAAFEAAVNETMMEIESQLEARVRKYGQDFDRKTGNAVWTNFIHHTSRPIDGLPDPQLHCHSVLFSLTHDPVENQWKAAQMGNIKAQAPYYQAAFRARFASKLQGLGYELAVKSGDFEVVGVPPRANKEFSRRTELIERVASSLGIERPESKAKLGATTRERKTPGVSWDTLLRSWDSRLSEAERSSIMSTVKDSKAREPISQSSLDNEAVDYALSHLLERSAAVSQRSVVQEALKHGLGSVTVEGIYKALGRSGIIRREIDGQEYVTTKQVLDEEKGILKFAIDGRGKHRPAGGKNAAERVIGEAETGSFQFTKSQKTAVGHVLTSPDRVMIVRGLAGVGKTTLTKTTLAGVDSPWVILAPSSDASRGTLRDEGLKSADTLAKFLNDEKMQRRVKDGLIWLDEASLAGSRDVSKLFKIARSLNARVVLSGDRRQHKSVARGDVLAMLEDKAGLPVAEVAEIKRQHGEYREAVTHLAKGKTTEAFEKLDEMGWIKESGLVDDYIASLKAGKNSLIVSPTHKDGNAITKELRERLKEEGIISKFEITLPTLVNLNLTEAALAEAKKAKPEGVILKRYGAYTPGEMQLAAGDQIRITAGGKDITGNHTLNNGGTYRVDGFDKEGNVMLGNGWKVSPDYQHWQHAYALTSYAAQGKSVENVFVSMPVSTFPAVNQETAYVAVSRGKLKATIYTDNRKELMEAVERSDKRLLASDLVKKPRHKLRHRLKARVAQLTKIATIAREKAHTFIKGEIYGRESYDQDIKR